MRDNPLFLFLITNIQNKDMCIDVDENMIGLIFLVITMYFTVRNDDKKK